MALDKFHTKLREYLRAGGYSQKQLAYELGLAPTFLSNKLHQHNFATLTLSEVKQIVKILAQWGVLTSQRQALELMALMNLSYSSFTPQEWQVPPLAQLELAAAPYPAFEEKEWEELEVVNARPYRPLHPGSLKLVPSPLLKQQLDQLPIPLRLPPRREDWQGTIQTGPLYNRVEEMAKLKQWVLEERCRIVAVLGMGGMGKTALTIQLAQQLKAHFEFVIWRSLYNAPPLESLLNDLLQVLAAPAALVLPAGLEARLSALLTFMQEQRVLLVLDNWETLLQEGGPAGAYRASYEEYGELLERVGQLGYHQSCLILTSREKPRGLGLVETKAGAFRSLRLGGLALKEAGRILQDQGLVMTSQKSTQDLVERYAGNPLALKLVVEPVQSLFGGQVEAFLSEGWSVFGEIEEVLAQQLKRLSELEQQVVYWLAVEREPVSLQTLKQELVVANSSKALAEALLALGRRSLLEKESDPQPRFSLQPVVLEYVTNQLVGQVKAELISGQLKLVRSHALLKAQAKDYVRASQRRLMVGPVVEGLLAHFSNQAAVEAHLTQLLDQLREEPFEQQGYSGGNVLNLLAWLKGNLNGTDFRGLRLWQADLQGLEAQGANFAGAELSYSNFTQAFDSIAAVAFSPDGQLVAGGCYNGEVRVWEVVSGQQLAAYQGHSAVVWSVAFSPDGCFLASGSADQTIKLWEVASESCLHTLEGHTETIYSVAFSPDGTSLASGSHDQTVKLWEVASGKCLKTLQGHNNWVESVAFSPNGLLLASGSFDQTIKLWEVASGECLRNLEGHANFVMSIAFSPDGRLVGSAGFDRTVKLWEVASGQCLKTLAGHNNWIQSVAFSPDGLLLASGSTDQTIKLWEVASGKCLKTLAGHNNWVYSIAFSPDGLTLASSGADQTIKLWEVASGQCLNTWQGYIHLVWAVACSPVGGLIASGSADQTVKLWEVASGECLKSLTGHSNDIRTVAFSPDGRRLASASLDRTIKLWEVASGKCLKTLTGHSGWVWSVAFSPDGRTLVSGSADQTIKLWDVASGQCLNSWQGHSNEIQAVAFSPDGQLVASGSADQTIKLWEVVSGQCLKTLTGHSDWVWSVAFSPDGRLLTSSGLDRTIKLWQVESGVCLNSLEGHSSVVWSVAFSPDGQTLASSSIDQTIRLWEVSSGRCLRTLVGHTNFIWSVAFSPDGQTLVSGSADQTIRLWPVASGECLKTLRAKRPYEEMNLSRVTGLSEAQRANLEALGAVSLV